MRRRSFLSLLGLGGVASALKPVIPSVDAAPVSASAAAAETVSAGVVNAHVADNLNAMYGSSHILVRAAEDIEPGDLVSFTVGGEARVIPVGEWRQVGLCGIATAPIAEGRAGCVQISGAVNIPPLDTTDILLGPDIKVREP